MTDKIIEAAREAGFRTGNITLSGEGVAPIPFIAPVSATNCQHELSRFYAIARAEALEDAAKACDEMSMICARTAPGSFDGRYDFMSESAKDCADAIRKLKEQQHG